MQEEIAIGTHLKLNSQEGDGMRFGQHFLFCERPDGFELLNESCAHQAIRSLQKKVINLHYQQP